MQDSERSHSHTELFGLHQLMGINGHTRTKAFERWDASFKGSLIIWSQFDRCTQAPAG